MVNSSTLTLEPIASRPATAQQKVFVVLPAFNEQDSLPPLFDAVRDALEPAGIPYSVIVVDDGSRDATALVTSRASLQMPVELVQHKQNQGLAAAIRTGLTTAAERAGANDVIVTMDADNTHPPRLIPGMLDKLREGNDVVIASRFQPGAVVHGVPQSRLIYSIGVRWMFQALLPIRNVRDFTCGYRAYRAESLRKTIDHYGDDLVTETGFSCMADVLLKMRRLPFRFAEVPLELHYDRRGDGSKMRVFRTIRQTLWLIFRRRLGFNR
jgi:dolichol-phosphate mannosyltransferase